MTCQYCNSPLKPNPIEGFTCGSWVYDHKGFRSAECQLSESNEYARKLNLKIADLCKERDELKAINYRANLDWADDDTKLREMCLKVGIPQNLIDGDTHYAPHIVGLGELLVQKIEGLRAKVARFEEVPENTTMADLVQVCKSLTSRNCRLEELGDALLDRVGCGCGVDGPCKQCCDAVEAWEENGAYR